MKIAYILVLILHAQAGADRVAVTIPGQWESKELCLEAAKQIEETPRTIAKGY